MLIFTTIQAQDFPDIDGDVASKRMRFPIYAPEFSRAFTLLVIPSWSIAFGKSDGFFESPISCWAFLFGVDITPREGQKTISELT
ncbi:hypothetical protein Hypma_013170 [Hypsizygus marmoreus]|uniref:Uncharacterized protein n=1 Tax=Hypsizygus marmoreus TaxID=39966 RepID=A0A369JJX3_HYPMA|nr:hypothetical protein Hypma_013170 [Hypsizygus marmoreus]